MFTVKPRYVILSAQVVDACEHMGYNIAEAFPVDEDIQPIKYPEELFKEYGHALAEHLRWRVAARDVVRRDIVYGTHLVRAGYLNPLVVLRWLMAYRGPGAPELAVAVYVASRKVKARKAKPWARQRDVLMRRLLEIISYSGDRMSRGFAAGKMYEMHDETLGEWFCAVQAAWRADLTPDEMRKLDLKFPASDDTAATDPPTGG